MVDSFSFFIFASNPSFFIRASYIDSCGIVEIAVNNDMEAKNINLINGKNKDTEVLIERDTNGFIWVYQGKRHGYDSWCGIPPEE